MNHFTWPTALRCCLIIALLAISPWGIAKNADQSQWLKNLSESALDSEPGYSDHEPEIAVSGTTVHVLWVATTPEKRILYYRRSTDLGQTWQPKIPLMESKESILTENENRKLAVSGNTVHVFQNHYRGSWYGVITYFRSTDNGASFEAGKDVVTAAGAHHLYDIYAHAEQDKVYLAYTNVRNWEVKDSINLLVSENNGDSFTNYPVAGFDKDQSDQRPRLFDMQAQGDRVALVYGDSYSYYGLRWHRLFAAVSRDGGKQFNRQRIDVPSNEDNNPKSFANTSENYAPKIAFGGDNVYFVFHAIDEQGKNAVFFRRSTDDGQTFDPAIKLSQELTDRTIECCHETIAAHGDKVYVIFLDKPGNLYFKRSLNGGASFEPAKVLNATPYFDYGRMAIAAVWWPQIRLDPHDETGSTVHVVATHLFHVYSNDAGANFSVPLTLYPPFGNSDLGHVKLAIDAEGALHLVSLGQITWYSSTGFGDRDIFYRRFHPIVTPTATTQQALLLQHHPVLRDNSGVERWDTMVIASHPALTFKDAFTAEAWIKVNRNEKAAGYFIYKTDPGKEGALGSILLGQWVNGHLDARITTEQAGYVLIGDTPIANDRWTHVAVTYDANVSENNLRIYLDGALAGQTTAKGRLATGPGTYLIGGGSSQGEGYRQLVIDELRFWNRARTQEEIAATMQQALSGKEPGLVAYYPFDESFNVYGTIRDVSGNHHTGVLTRKEQLTEGYAVKQSGLKLVAPRSLIDAQHDAILSAQFLGEDQGDLYVAAIIAGQPGLFFLDEAGAFHPNRPVAFRRNGRFSGTLPIFTLPGAIIPQGRYRLYAVVTDAGANIFDVARWHGPLAQFLFIAREPIADGNGDGWADQDRDRDGFLDNDRDFDGYAD